MLTDLRNAVRALRAAPGFTFVALAVLALGTGATTAIFSVVDAVILRGLPYDQADRIVAVHEDNFKSPQNSRYSVTTAQNFTDWKAQQDVFEAIGASAGGGGFVLREGGEPLQLNGVRVTASLFNVLRVGPRIGRAFSESDEIQGNHRVAIISDGLWRSRFAADPKVIGRTMTSDTGTWEIVGVMPPDFSYPITARGSSSIHMWVPYVVAERDKTRGNSRSYHLSVLGRLKPGVTVDQAQAKMDQITAGLATAFPGWFRDRGVKVRLWRDAIVNTDLRKWMLTLLGAVAFVLLIACVNVANLMLARATARSRELGIRGALGATRWQLARALLVESVVLSIAGTLCGLALAYFGVDVLRASMPGYVPRIADVGVDLRVLTAAAAVAILTGVAFGLAPAWQFSRPNVGAALRDGRANTAGTRRQRLRSLLIVSEVALAVVLLVGAGLFVSSFVRLMRIDVGINYDKVLTLPVYPRVDFASKENRERDMAVAANVVAQVIEQAQALPGVTSASAISGGLPLSGNWSRTTVKVPGTEKEFDDDDQVDIRQVTAAYADVLGMKLIRGRWIAAADTRGAQTVVVLNDEAVKRYFGDRDPVGTTVGINGERLVVGVVRGVRLGGPETQVRPEAYVAIAQDLVTGGDLVVRTTGDPEAVGPALRAIVQTALPAQSIAQPQTLESIFRRLIEQRRFNMLLLSLFGVLGIMISGAGIYGVMAYIVEQRTQEIGVRMALGAEPGGILRMVLGRATAFTMAGLVLGLGGALALSRFVTSFLFQVTGRDPVVYVAVGALLLTIALVAALIPALRASRVDPIIALRT